MSNLSSSSSSSALSRIISLGEQGERLSTEYVVKYLEENEEFEKLGARFFRAFAGVKTPEESRAIDPITLESYLRILTPKLGEGLAQRKSLAGKPTPKNLTRHLGNAFPSLKRLGTTLRKGSTALPSKSFVGPGCDSSETLVQLENKEVWSFVLSWEWKTHGDIMDDTVITPLAMGESSAPTGIDPASVYPPQETGFTPRDVGFTSEYLRAQVSLAYARGFKDGAGIQDDAPVTHVGWTVDEIDAMIRFMALTSVTKTEAETASVVQGPDRVIASVKDAINSVA